MKSISKKNFIIIEGNNGSTYIFNIANSSTINNSLRFYKDFTLRQKILKFGINMYLYSKNIIVKLGIDNNLKTAQEIKDFLYYILPFKMDINIDEDCSILISPTKDKVIINYHNRYLHKFGFKKSYDKIKNEASIYFLLNNSNLKYFNVYEIFDVVDINGAMFSFKIKPKERFSYNKDIILALSEMFSITINKNYSFEEYIHNLKYRLQSQNIDEEIIHYVLNEIITRFKDFKLPLGLTHRDFKPWNININNSRLFIYDFEETVENGLLLEDLLNYKIDPIIRYISYKQVVKEILKDSNINEYKRYIKTLNIDIDFKPLIFLYIIERILFWTNQEKIEISKCYFNLLNHLYKENLI